MKKKEINVIIIDDEKLARDLVRNYLQAFDNIKIIDECTNGFDGIKSITKNNPDLVFLDIQMPKLTGFEMLELLDEVPNIIFTTAFDEYALKAFEVNAVDYLLKPFSRERFSNALEKVTDKIEYSNAVLPQQNSYKNLAKTDEKLNRIVVKKNNNIVIIPTDSVKYIEAQDDYVKIVTHDGSYLKQNRMKYYEEHLPDSFVRVHRSYIVNFNEIKEIALIEKDTHVVVLKNGEKISVSKNGYTKLREMIR